MLFSAVQRKYDLTDRQMFYIREKLKKYHEKDEWLVAIFNPDSMSKELWIYLEGVEWIRDVYLNFDVPYRKAEINFVKKHIVRLENELGIHLDPLQIETGMTVDMLALYFNRSKTRIYNILSPYRKSHPHFFIDTNDSILSKEGIVYLEKHFFLDRYIQDLYLYKRFLQERKMLKNEKERRQ